MAISRKKKEAVVDEMSKLLSEAKLAAFAHYEGLTVADLQQLRREARASDVDIRVAKNRLVKIALKQDTNFKDVDSNSLKGQLLYAVSSKDEVAPAQILATFSRTHEALKMVGGINGEGHVLDEADIKMLASLPTKEQLRAQLVGTIAAPVTGFVNVLAGNVRSVLNVLSARGEVLEKQS